MYVFSSPLQPESLKTNLDFSSDGSRRRMSLCDHSPGDSFLTIPLQTYFPLFLPPQAKNAPAAAMPSA